VPLHRVRRAGRRTPPGRTLPCLPLATGIAGLDHGSAGGAAGGGPLWGVGNSGPSGISRVAGRHGGAGNLSLRPHAGVPHRGGGPVMKRLILPTLTVLALTPVLAAQDGPSVTLFNSGRTLV